MLKPGRTNTVKNGMISLGRVEAATTLSPKVFRQAGYYGESGVELEKRGTPPCRKIK